MTIDLADLPPALDTAQAAELFGVSVDLLQELARKGTAPIEPIRLGRLWRWPTALVLAALGLRTGEGAPAKGALEPSPPSAVERLRRVSG